MAEASPADVIADVPASGSDDKPVRGSCYDDTDDRKAQQEEQRQMEDAHKQRNVEWRAMVDQERGKMSVHDNAGARGKPNRFGVDAEFPAWVEGKSIPTLALINPKSGAKAGDDILAVAHKCKYYQSRFFNIIDVIKGSGRGQLMDVFREALTEAKEAAKKMGTRPRLISGGGDGTASFALFILFKTLQADPDRIDEGLADAGNGFIWTEEEMVKFFPALAQLPLGSANDFANIIGWGQKYPGDPGHCGCCSGGSKKARALTDWIGHVIDPRTKMSNFDVWGLMPANREASCDFKIAELDGNPGLSCRQRHDGKLQLEMKTAGKPVPFFILLYFSVSFPGYLVARFQLNRHDTPVKNRLEYVKQGVKMYLERTPPQILSNCRGVKVDCAGEKYFPPRNKKDGGGYMQVGFMNVNWQAHLMHGADRAGCFSRLCTTREPVKFNDGLLDMYRMRLFTFMKNPGPRLQTDKRKEMTLTFDAPEGKGLFFQYDGEARFAFSPDGKPFSMHIRKALNIPILLGPRQSPGLTKIAKDTDDSDVKFGFGGDGDSKADQDLVIQRIMKSLAPDGSDNLDAELNGTKEELTKLHMMHPK